jgi:hypothetical protein
LGVEMGVRPGVDMMRSEEGRGEGETKREVGQIETRLRLPIGYVRDSAEARGAASDEAHHKSRDEQKHEQ